MSLAAAIVMEPTTDIQPSQVLAQAEAAKAAALEFVEHNKVLVVDMESCQRAVIVRQQCAVRKAGVVETLAKPKSWAFNLHRWFCGLENAGTNPYDLLDGFERDQIQRWNGEQAEIARQRERELAEEGRKAEEARAITEAAAMEQAALRAATREEARDLEAQAVAVLHEAIAAPSPIVVVQSAAKQVIGLKTRRDWKWRFVGGPDPKKDVMRETPPAVIERALTRMPREYLTVDVKKVDGIVDAMKLTTKIPGIEVYYVDVPVR